MKLIIVRHGETEENKQGIIQGHLPGTLSEEGIVQARKIANRLKDEKIDYVFSSDSDRAKHTAEEIIKFHQDIPFELKEELRERRYGDFEGQKKEEVKTKEIWNDSLIVKYGGESPEEVTKRIVDLKDEFLQNFNGKRILIVTHNAITNFLLKNLTKEYSKIRLGNTSMTIFEFDENKEPKLVLLNCAKHLED